MPIQSYLSLLLLALGLVLLWRLWRIEALQGRLWQALVRTEAGLEAQARHAEALSDRLERRALHTEQRVQLLDRDLRSAHGALRQYLERRLGELHAAQADQLARTRDQQVRALAALSAALKRALAGLQMRFEERQTEALKTLHDSLQSGLGGLQGQIGETLRRHTGELNERVEGLTRSTDRRLAEIGGQVERRLSEGFEKTTATFADVVRRLALIDEAQRRITELSGNVVSLQEVLADKRARGAFGEVQLASLVRNEIPEAHFALQHPLPNGRVVDCMLFLPEPTGNVAIDAKFPLEAYRRMTDTERGPEERRRARKTFKQDLRRHIQDIASRYILPGVTSDGAMMFIPAEAVFAEIQAHHPDLVETSYAARVWMCSPTTLMAILNTARAVLKDAATRTQVHLIQRHLTGLAKDFERFRRRMDGLARHIQQANQDVEQVHLSAGKIARRFDRIEQVDLEDEAPHQAVPAPASAPSVRLADQEVHR